MFWGHDKKQVEETETREPRLNTNSKAIRQIVLASRKQINLQPVIIISLRLSIHLNIMDKWCHESFPSPVFGCTKGEAFFVVVVFF